MTYPITIKGKDFPAIAQAGVELRIWNAPFDTGNLGKKFRTVDAEWCIPGAIGWLDVPFNSKQAIDIAALIDGGEIR